MYIHRIYVSLYAFVASSDELPPYHTLRVESVASYASFLHQEEGQRQKAIDLARKTFKEAVDALDTVGDKDFPAVIRALRTLLRLINWWANDTKRMLVSAAVV